MKLCSSPVRRRSNTALPIARLYWNSHAIKCGTLLPSVPWMYSSWWLPKDLKLTRPWTREGTYLMSSKLQILHSKAQKGAHDQLALSCTLVDVSPNAPVVSPTRVTVIVSATFWEEEGKELDLVKGDEQHQRLVQGEKALQKSWGMKMSTTSDFFRGRGQRARPGKGSNTS